MRQLLSATYVLGLVIAEGLRLPQRWRRASFRSKPTRPKRTRHVSEVIVLLGIAGGIWALPLGAVCTDWLQAFDYVLPDWSGWLGIGIFLASLALRWAAQSALGSSWSPTLETDSQQHLVTSGVYGWIRHPIYSSLLLWAIAQPLLLQNILAGFSGALAVALIWLLRVPAEERMMVERFGDAYVQLMERTGKVIPRFK